MLSKYCSLVAKLDLEACSCHATTKVKATLLDVEVMLGLACLIPMFFCINALIKLAQARVIYVYDVLPNVKVCLALSMTHVHGS